MKYERAIALAAVTASVAACGEKSNPEPANLKHVGHDAWVRVLEPAYSVNNEFYAGNKCVIVREADLILRNGGVVYRHDREPDIGYDEPGGTECPNGAELDLSPGQVERQDARYQKFISRKEEVTSQVRGMHDNESSPEAASDTWVDVVNPSPIANGNMGYKYGDECVAEGTARQIGRLKTGENVMQLSVRNPYGTICPDGTIYLERPKETIDLSTETEV
jgi:hypothetical protein